MRYGILFPQRLHRLCLKRPFLERLQLRRQHEKLIGCRASNRQTVFAYQWGGFRLREKRVALVLKALTKKCFELTWSRTPLENLMPFSAVAMVVDADGMGCDS